MGEPLVSVALTEGGGYGYKCLQGIRKWSRHLESSLIVK